MPMVDYKDLETGDVFELYIRSKDIPDTVKNPETGNDSERLFTIGSVGFEFKGPGFYATEYKNKPSGE